MDNTVRDLRIELYGLAGYGEDEREVRLKELYSSGLAYARYEMDKQAKYQKLKNRIGDKRKQPIGV